LHRLGKADVDSDGSKISAPLYRAWTDIKAKVGAGDSAYLEGAEKGEDYAKAAYSEALEGSTLPADIRTIVQAQYDSILRVHNHVKSLRDARKAA
jgi:uncharacterized protein (TIGR02284 family)